MHYLEKELYDRIIEGDSVFDFIQNSVLDGICYWDIENPENFYLSPGFYKAFGYKNDVPIDKDWTKLIHPEDLERSSNLMYHHFQTSDEPFEQVVRYKHLDGNYVWVRYKGIRICDEKGNPTRILGVHTLLRAFTLNEYNVDKTEINASAYVTEQSTNHNSSDKKFIGGLYESQKKEQNITSFLSEVSEQTELSNEVNSKNALLELLVNHTEDFVLVFNDKLQLIYSNKQYEKIIGYKIEKYPLDLDESMKFIHPDHRDFIFEKYDKARLNKEKNVVEQHKANNKDGKEIWLEDYLTFEYDSEGNYKRAYIVSRDITKRKIIELSLEKESQKQKEIAELLIEEKEIGKDELYNNLKGAVEGILIESKNELEKSDYLENKYIKIAYQHLNSAIEEVQKIVLESSSQFISEQQFIAGITNYFNSINFSSKVNFRIEDRLTNNLNFSEKQKKHLFRICQELAQNATKHSNASEMTFRFKQNNNELILVAKDNGIGCDKNKIESGIGIRNIQNRVYLMNGKIRFFYFKKTGLTIFISLIFHRKLK